MILGAMAWRGYRLERFPDESWTVVDGVLSARADGPPISLISIRQYADFDLSLEWCLPQAGNSGILYRVTESMPQPWQSGVELQLVDGMHHRDGLRAQTSCGALYDLFAPNRGFELAADEFHSARLVVNGTQVEHWLAGRCVLQFSIESAAFYDAVARSKFKDIPGFAASRTGHIVLQHHHTRAWFRNIEISTRD